MCLKNSKDDNLYTKNVKEMDFEKLKSFLIQNAGSVSVFRITGGEPFVYSHIDELLDLLNEYKIRFSLQTNGYLLNRQRAEKLLKNCIEVSISIDSADAETYSRIRKNGKLETVTENIKQLSALRKKRKTPHLNIAAACFSFNIDGLSDLVRYCHELGVPTLSVSEGAYYNTKEINETDFIRNNPRQVSQAIRTAQEVAGKLGVTMRLNSSNLTAEEPGSRIRKRPELIRNCVDFYFSCVVQPDFDVKICCNADAVYKLTDGDLKTFWNSEKMAGYRKMASAGKFPESCHYCNDFNEFVRSNKEDYSYIDFQKKTQYWKTD